MWMIFYSLELGCLSNHGNPSQCIMTKFEDVINLQPHWESFCWISEIQDWWKFMEWFALKNLKIGCAYLITTLCWISRLCDWVQSDRNQTVQTLLFTICSTLEVQNWFQLLWNSQWPGDIELIPVTLKAIFAPSCIGVVKRRDLKGPMVFQQRYCCRDSYLFCTTLSNQKVCNSCRHAFNSFSYDYSKLERLYNMMHNPQGNLEWEERDPPQQDGGYVKNVDIYCITITILARWRHSLEIV